MIVSRTITGTEPVTLNEAKLWLKVDYTADDTLITDLISHCRELIENYIERSLVASTVTVEVFAEGTYILPLPNHISVDAVTLDGAATDEYIATGTSLKRITFTSTGVYRITYKTDSLVFPALKTLLKKLIAHNYENRNAISEMPKDIYSALMQYTR